ncbi:MAG: TlpA disulfide reductase family protein [Bacteroidales bacterium]|jgi:thiol-disulfide isomerase/thioredoxin|nr:TlpA disulfide reductase family protein [Bacteroidales bacterium]
MRIILGLFFLLFIGYTGAQNILQGRITGYENQKLSLAKYKGDRLYITDTVITTSDGKFSFIDKKYLSGQFRLVINSKKSVDFFFDGHPQTIQTHIQYFADSLKANAESGTELYFKFTQAEIKYHQKLDLLGEMLDRYPDSDEFYKNIEREYINSQYSFNQLLEKAIGNCNNSLLKSYLTTRRQSTIPFILKAYERIVWQKEHDLLPCPFTDSLLIRTNAYSRRIIEFLALYSDPSMNKSEIQTSFILGLQKLKSYVSPNPVVFTFITNYLIEGFERYGFEDVLLYMSDQFKPQSCDNPASISVQERLDAIRRLSTGNPAPAINGFDSKGHRFNSRELKKPYTLVVFWASWCPHCNEILPQLREIYDQTKQKDWEVLAFSIDTDQKAWLNSLKQHQFQWINISDLKGWDGETATAWALNATPVFFLIDKDQRIIAKPTTYAEIVELLDNLKLL